jgi:hypothetical protein
LQAVDEVADDGQDEQEDDYNDRDDDVARHGCCVVGGLWRRRWLLVVGTRVESLVRTCGDLFMRETCFLLYSSGRAELVSYGISFECRLSMS